jgi:hypothetical protein
MKTVRAVVDLLGSILALIKDQLGLFIKRSLAVELYHEGRLFLGNTSDPGRGKGQMGDAARVSSLITPQWPTNSDKLISSADR